MITRHLFAAAAGAALFLAACSSSESSRPDAGQGDSGQTDSGQTDTGTPPPDGGGGPEGAALVDRASTGELTCSVTAPLVNHSPRSWYQGGHVIVTRGQEAIVVRTESMPPSPFEQAPTYLMHGALAADGTLGATENVATLPNGTGDPAAAIAGDNLVIVGVDGESFFSTYVGPGAPGGTTPLALGTSGPIYSTQLVPGHGGAAFVWTRHDFNTSRTSLSFARLTATGALDGTPVVLENNLQSFSQIMVATDTGWALIRRTESALIFQRLAADGAIQGQHVLSSDGETRPGFGTGFDRIGASLLPHGDGFIAAWSESKQTFDAGAYSAIRLARLDANGAPRETPIWVREPEVDIDEVEPHLTRLGSRVALTWGRGTHIYICAGCVPDHQIDLLVFDPDTLAPVSNLATLPKPAFGGILQREEAWIGDTLRIAAAITFHVHSEPGTAVFTCN